MNASPRPLGAAIAVAAAVRSTWSPCGLSMLSSITPLAERSRGHRFGVTATWFMLGSVLGGATLGVLAAGLAARRSRRRSRTHDGERDPGRAGPRDGAVRRSALRLAPALPRPPGQRAVAGPVPPVGLRGRVRLADRLRAGHLHHDRRPVPHVVAAIVGASPTAALAIATAFGLVRGLAVLLSARITTIESLHRFHRRFDACPSPSG